MDEYVLDLDALEADPALVRWLIERVLIGIESGVIK